MDELREFITDVIVLLVEITLIHAAITQYQVGHYWWSATWFVLVFRPRASE